jgi:Flp pilus assembly protein TadD
LTNLGLAVGGQGRAAEAEAFYRRAEAIFAEMLPPEHQTMGRLLHDLGLALIDQGKRDEARAVLQRAWPIRRTAEDDPRLRAETAFALARVSDRVEARPLLQRAQQEAERAGSPADDLRRRIARAIARG